MTDKERKKVVGQIGLLPENIEGKNYIGVGYILKKEEWGRGYATEGATACIRYAFRQLETNEVIADIRPENKASIAVAIRLGMKPSTIYEKKVFGKVMPHILYKLKNPYL